MGAAVRRLPVRGSRNEMPAALALPHDELVPVMLT